MGLGSVVCDSAGSLKLVVMKRLSSLVVVVGEALALLLSLKCVIENNLAISSFEELIA